MEKLDKVIAGLERCADLDRSCVGCPYEDLDYCEIPLMKDALEWLRKMDDLELTLEVTRMNLGNSREECNRLEYENEGLKNKLKIARAERNQAWGKLARITGEREAKWLEEAFELRTCYCPICDKHFEVRSNDSMGDCPDCGHHVVLWREVDR